MTVQNHRPKIAIIDPNTLATLGLKQLLLNMMPIVTIDTFGTLAELEANDADIYAHYFVSLVRPLYLPSRSTTARSPASSTPYASISPSPSSFVNCLPSSNMPTVTARICPLPLKYYNRKSFPTAKSR